MTTQRSVIRKRILLTGAAGGIGSAFFRSAAPNYFFRLADRETTSIVSTVSQEHEVYALEVADLEACQQACQDIDIVLHLAAATNPEAGFYQSLLQNNICGTYNIFQAAQDQGCQRVIFASSAQVFAGYPDDVQAHPESRLRPMNMYGACKCFGEAVASYFAHAEGLSSIVLRIGSYDVNGDASNWLRQQPNIRHLSGYLSERDLNHLLVRCIEAPDVQFAIFMPSRTIALSALISPRHESSSGMHPRMTPLRYSRPIYRHGYRTNLPSSCLVFRCERRSKDPLFH